MNDGDIRASLEELSQAIKLLAITTKVAGYEALRGQDDRLEAFTREIERVCLFADKVIQRLHNDTGTLAKYPPARTGDLSAENEDGDG